MDSQGTERQHALLKVHNEIVLKKKKSKEML